MAIQLSSDRVLLREWRVSDLEPWISLNQDPVNLQYFPRLYSPDESRDSFNRISVRLAQNAFGLWAAVEKSTDEFMGFIGMAEQNMPGVPFMPCVEIGWRLDKKYWGRGYATEAAQVVLEFGLNSIGLNEIFSYTAPQNLPSINVMKKIGLHARPELDFAHPNIDDDSPVKRHVVYST